MIWLAFQKDTAVNYPRDGFDGGGQRVKASWKAGTIPKKIIAIYPDRDSKFLNGGLYREGG